MVKLNACPFVGVLGDLVIPDIVGVPIKMVKVCPFDGVPLEPFLTCTVKLPKLLSVTGAMSRVEVLLVITPLDITQGLQLGPVSSICAVEVLKLLPFTVSENVPIGELVGDMLLVVGLAAF